MGILQKGTYENVLITSSALQPGKSDDDPVIVISFTDTALDEGINAYLYTTEKAWPYTRAKLEACGFDINAHDGDLQALNGADSPIVGKRVRIVVDEQLYEGKMRQKVVQIGDTVFTERMEPAQAASFAAKLRARLVTSGEVKGGGARKATPKPAAPAKAEAPTDDVPF